MIEPAVHNAEAEAVRAAAVRLWPDLLRTVNALRSLSFTGPDAVRNNTYGAVDEQGRSLTVRLDGVPLPDGEADRTGTSSCPGGLLGRAGPARLTHHHGRSQRYAVRGAGQGAGLPAAGGRRSAGPGRASPARPAQPSAGGAVAGGRGSRLLPADLFDAATASMVTEHGLVEAPPESGNVAAGFMATALQAKHRADERNRASSAYDRGLG